MNQYQINRIKSQYPKGTGIELISMKGEIRMPNGLTGTVILVDDAGQIHVDWENGSTLALIPGEDSYRKLPQLDETHTENNGPTLEL